MKPSNFQNAHTLTVVIILMIKMEPHLAYPMIKNNYSKVNALINVVNQIKLISQLISYINAIRKIKK
jgi:hypothetical protein